MTPGVIFCLATLVTVSVVTAKPLSQAQLHPGYRTKDTVQLDLQYYTDHIRKSKDHWVVVFCKPGCPYCGQLNEHWAEVAEELKDQVKFGSVNIKTERSIYRTFKPFLTEGVPVIAYLEPNPMTGVRSVAEYPSGYTAEELRAWVLKMINADEDKPSERREHEDDW